jgi:hypothetical protein
MKGFHVKTLAPRGNNEDEANNPPAAANGEPGAAGEGAEASADAEAGTQTTTDQSAGESKNSFFFLIH